MLRSGHDHGSAPSGHAELPRDTDVDLWLDLLAGPLYWRMTEIHKDLTAADLDRLADKVVAAFKA